MTTDDLPSQDAVVPRVRRVIERLARDGTVVAESDGSEHDVFPVAINSEEGEALRNWVANEHAKQTIEIGLGYGFSTLHVCEGLLLNGNSDARHVVPRPQPSPAILELRAPGPRRGRRQANRGASRRVIGDRAASVSTRRSRFRFWIRRRQPQIRRRVSRSVLPRSSDSRWRSCVSGRLQPSRNQESRRPLRQQPRLVDRGIIDDRRRTPVGCAPHAGWAVPKRLQVLRGVLMGAVRAATVDDDVSERQLVDGATPTNLLSPHDVSAVTVVNPAWA